jgi:hypothetical protein
MLQNTRLSLIVYYHFLLIYQTYDILFLLLYILQRSHDLYFLVHSSCIFLFMTGRFIEIVLITSEQQRPNKDSIKVLFIALILASFVGLLYVNYIFRPILVFASPPNNTKTTIDNNTLENKNINNTNNAVNKTCNSPCPAGKYCIQVCK